MYLAVVDWLSLNLIKVHPKLNGTYHKGLNNHITLEKRQ